MSVRCGARVYRFVKLEMFANAAWREIHGLAERLGKFGFIDLSGVVGIDIK